MQLLKKLCDTISPSGNESKLIDTIYKEIYNIVDEISIDNLGNLIAHRKGKGKKIIFSTAIDEVGIILTTQNKTENNCQNNLSYKFHTIGDVKVNALQYKKMSFDNKLIGLCVQKSDNVDKQPKIEDFDIQLITECKGKNIDIFSPGNVAGFVNEFNDLEDKILSKSLSNRTGAYILIKIIHDLKESVDDIYFIFNTQSKIGNKGSRVSAYNINPDIIIDISAMEIDDNKGVGILVKDKGVVCNSEINSQISDICNKKNILHYYAISEESSNLDGYVAGGCNGKFAGIIIPIENINTDVEIVEKDNIRRANKLISTLIKRGL